MLGFEPAEIEHIVSVYDSRSETIDDLQRRFPDHPRNHFHKVARKHGKAKPASRRWTEREENFLINHRHRFSPKEMVEKLERSEWAVDLKLKKLGYNWIQGVSGFYTMRGVARIFGVDSHTVGWWIDSGWLKGDRFPTRIGPYYPRRISYEAICGFIEDEGHWHLWEPNRMKPGIFKEWTEECRNGRGEFLTTGQVAKSLFYVHRTIGQWVRKGKLKARKHGPNWKIPRKEVERLTLELAKHESGEGK